MTSRRPYLWTKQWIGGHVCVQKKILWELNSFHMLKLSFIPSNLQSCWPCDWKRSIGLISKITTLHVYHTFFQCKLLCRHCTNTTWKCLISPFMEDVNKPRRGFLFPSELGYVSKEFNSRRVRLHKSKWVEMIAKKIEGTLYHFLSDFFVAAAAFLRS